MITLCYWLLSGLHIYIFFFFCSWNTCSTQSHIALLISFIDNLLCNKMIHNVGLWLIASSCERLKECGGKKQYLNIWEMHLTHYSYIMMRWQCCLLSYWMWMHPVFFLSRGAIHQHIGVQLPDPGECGEWDVFFLWDAVTLHCLSMHTFVYC